jgi:hypothetical protein
MQQQECVVPSNKSVNPTRRGSSGNCCHLMTLHLRHSDLGRLKWQLKMAAGHLGTRCQGASVDVSDRQQRHSFQRSDPAKCNIAQLCCITYFRDEQLSGTGSWPGHRPSLSKWEIAICDGPDDRWGIVAFLAFLAE